MRSYGSSWARVRRRFQTRVEIPGAASWPGTSSHCSSSVVAHGDPLLRGEAARGLLAHAVGESGAPLLSRKDTEAQPRIERRVERDVAERAQRDRLAPSGRAGQHRAYEARPQPAPAVLDRK